MVILPPRADLPDAHSLVGLLVCGIAGTHQRAGLDMAETFENTLGSIPSEAFTLTGPGGTTPEPSSIMLFGSGILGLAGVLQRRRF
ncbi:MAG TPA: PEP-CTERM sorting domain-containing protein [Terriglobales bacterium]